MDEANREKAWVKKNSRWLFIVSVIVFVIVLLALLLIQFAAPKRSVAAYCRTYAEEKARLAKLPGDTWPSGVFNDRVGDAGEFAASFGKLEKVAPDEIRPDVATLKSIYQKIHDDPSQAISASLSGTGAESSVKQWTSAHCSN